MLASQKHTLYEAPLKQGHALRKEVPHPEAGSRCPQQRITLYFDGPELEVGRWIEGGTCLLFTTSALGTLAR